MDYRLQGGFPNLFRRSERWCQFPLPAILAPTTSRLPAVSFLISSVHGPATSTHASPLVSDSRIQGPANGRRHRVTIDVDADEES
uniref:Uncharacterized protein n=1 Tax=Arundo donax TaxID=35708 RepID=A0A0A9HAZ6_ARUDO